VGGGLAGGCLNVLYNRFTRLRDLRTKLFPIMNNVYAAYTIRMENTEGRYWVTTVGEVPLKEDEEFIGPTDFRGLGSHCGTFGLSHALEPTSRRSDLLCGLWAMYAERSEGFAGFSGTINSSGGSMVERSTIHLASWFGSRGSFSFPTVMAIMMAIGGIFASPC
jgi:hypothetical protein